MYKKKTVIFDQILNKLVKYIFNIILQCIYRDIRINPRKGKITIGASEVWLIICR